MPPEAIPPRLSYRVLDANTGNVIIPDLPHLHQSQWTVRGLQAGFPGSATLGDFHILLPPAASDMYARNKVLYDQLAVRQRIEGYLEGVSAGTPLVSGILTKPPVLYYDQPCVLSGTDSLWLLQAAQLNPNETVGPGTFATAIVQQYLCGPFEIVWADDFSNWNGGGSGNYVNSGWAFTSADPHLGLPALTTSTSGAHLVTTSTWPATGQYQTCAITVHGSLTPSSDASDAGEIQILLLSDSAGATATMVRALFRQDALGTVYDVDAQIYHVAGGVFTLQAQATNVLNQVPSNTLIELTTSITGGFIDLVINGKSAGLIGTLSGTTPGGIGISFQPAHGGVAYINRLEFRARPGAGWGTVRFRTGTIGISNRFVGQHVGGGGTTFLDLLLMSATLDGYSLRKTPGVGYKSDVVDYALSPGLDLSASVIFEEGVNVDASGTLVDSVADLFATDVRMNGVPGGDTGGSMTWGRIGSAGDMVLVDTSSDVGVPTAAFILAYARVLQARKSNPGSAVQVKVARTADLLRWNGGIGPRELDFVTVHLPLLNVVRARQQIIGWTIDETSALVTYFLNELPLTSFVQAPLHRLGRGIEFLMNTYGTR